MRHFISAVFLTCAASLAHSQTVNNASSNDSGTNSAAASSKQSKMSSTDPQSASTNLGKQSKMTSERSSISPDSSSPQGATSGDADAVPNGANAGNVKESQSHQSTKGNQSGHDTGQNSKRPSGNSRSMETSGSKNR